MIDKTWATGINSSLHHTAFVAAAHGVGFGIGPTRSKRDGDAEGCHEAWPLIMIISGHTPKHRRGSLDMDQTHPMRVLLCIRVWTGIAYRSTRMKIDAGHCSILASRQPKSKRWSRQPLQTRLMRKQRKNTKRDAWIPPESRVQTGTVRENVEGPDSNVVLFLPVFLLCIHTFSKSRTTAQKGEGRPPRGADSNNLDTRLDRPREPSRVVPSFASARWHTPTPSALAGRLLAHQGLAPSALQ